MNDDIKFKSRTLADRYTDIHSGMETEYIAKVDITLNSILSDLDSDLDEIMNTLPTQYVTFPHKKDEYVDNIVEIFMEYLIYIIESEVIANDGDVSIINDGLDLEVLEYMKNSIMYDILLLDEFVEHIDDKRIEKYIANGIGYLLIRILKHDDVKIIIKKIKEVIVREYLTVNDMIIVTLDKLYYGYEKKEYMVLNIMKNV